MIDKRRLAAAALSASLLMAALPALAVAQDDEDPYPAEGIEWLLTAYSTDGSITTVPSGVEATLLLEAGEASGSAGCNSFSGSYEIHPATISFGPLAVTRAFCEGVEQLVEDAYLPLLQEAARWAVADEQLTLSDAEGTPSLVFAELPVVITASDVEALRSGLESMVADMEAMQEQLDALVVAASSADGGAVDERFDDIEDRVEFLEGKVDNVNSQKQKDRITVNEAAIAENTAAIAKMQDTIGNHNKRLKTLEQQVEALEIRVGILEDLVPSPEPLPE